MKKVLIISYYFTKDEYVGTVRIKGLAKFLHDYGWDPTILTTTTSSPKDYKIDYNARIIETSCENIVDTWRKRLGLFSEKPFKEHIGLKIHKNKKCTIDYLLNFWLEIFAYPDPEMSWYHIAMKECNVLFKNERFDAVISSSGPVTSHIIAKSLKIRYGIPWIADFRDPWTQLHSYPYSRLRKYREEKLEISTISHADLVTTVSLPLANTLGELHKKSKIYVVTNGFDPEDAFHNRVILNDKFNMVYTGNINSKYQDPEVLFKVLYELISEYKLDPRKISLDFYCRNEWWLENERDKYNLHDIINYKGFIPRKYVMEKQRQAQILLLLTWNDCREKGVYTGKIFEYLAAKRPIISLGICGGVVKELLQTTNAGAHASSECELKKELLKAYTEFESKGIVSYHGIQLEIDKFSQKEMAKKFGYYLEKLAKNDHDRYSKF